MKLSAEKALRNHFVWEAWNYLKKALKVLNRLPSNDVQDKKKLEILHMMIIPIVGLGLPEGSIDFLEEGLRISKKTGDRKGMIRFFGNSGVYYNNQGQPEKGTAYIGKAFETAESIGDLDAMAQTGPDICLVYIRSGNYRKVFPTIARLVKAIESSRREADYFGGLTNIYSGIHAVSGFSLGMLGDFEGAFDSCEKALDAARKYGGPETIGLCEYFAGAVHLTKGNGKESRDLLQKAVDHFIQANFLWHLPLCRSTLGLSEAFMGNPEKGLRHVQKGLEYLLQAEKLFQDLSMTHHLDETRDAMAVLTH